MSSIQQSVPTAPLAQAVGNFINGRWVPSSESRTLPLLNPTTEEPLGEFTDATAEDVIAAVDAASDALPAWAETPVAERVRLVRALVGAVGRRRDEFAQLQTTQMGSPITGSRAAVADGLAIMSEAADAAERFAFEVLRRDEVGQSLIRREPVGVVAAITPWNRPFGRGAAKFGPALLAGCTIVTKASPETPLETNLFADICAEVGLPDGVFNVVSGGREVGQALVADPRVAHVSFTGSTGAGRDISGVAGARFARLSLELGGKSAAILLDDVDLAAAMPILSTANFRNSGQACLALTRVLVSKQRHDEYVAAAVEMARSHVIGDPNLERTTMGPLSSAAHRERVDAYIRSAVEEGAAVAYGGQRPDGFEHGFYLQPTVLTGVRPHMRVAQEEIFGPVMSVMAYEDVDDAVAIANSTAFGLHGGVFTSDPERGLRVAERVRTGTIAINGFGVSPATPFGGVGDSGVGREQGIEGVEAFLETKAYALPPELYDSLAARGIPLG
jgi:aldehyde dehydrogenase (NAD+)